MKRFIAELPVGPYHVALFETDDPIDGGEALGEWDPETLSIVLDASLDGARRWVILLHELIHCLSDLSDIDIDKEHVCTIIGCGLTQALARFLPPPPRCRPPLPRAMQDDESTPSIDVVPITRPEQMK